MRALLPKVIKRLWYVIAGMLILFAILVVSGRLLTPYMNRNLPSFEAWASEVLKAPVTIDKVYLSWEYYEPTITFSNVKFIDNLTHATNFKIARATINLNMLRSFFEKKVVVECITISGAAVNLHQAKSGQWDIEGLTGIKVSDSLTGSSLEGNAVLHWIFSLPKLTLEDVETLFYTESGQTLSFTLKRLNLNNTHAIHKIYGRAILNQAIPTKLSMFVKWEGNLSDLAHVKAHSYVYIEAINLPQWIGRQVWHNLQVKQGLGSLKIWADWDKNAWQKLQSRMQFYDVEVLSLDTNKTQTIPRFNGDLGWRQEGNTQIFAGDQIFIDLTNHLWPATSFYVQMKPDATGIYFPEEIRTGYVDLSDLTNIAANVGLLTDDFKLHFLNFNPKGEFYNFQFKNLTGTPLLFPLTKSDDKKFLCKANFSGLTANAVVNYPGIKNLSGHLNWDGKEGDLQLKSVKTILDFKKLFAKELKFDRLISSIKFKHALNDEWFVDVENISISNSDANIKLKMKLNLPSNDSPNIDLSGDFSILQAENFVNYVPAQKLESDFVKWLKQALLSGQINAGKVVVQGKVANIPFDDGKGKFYLSCDTKDLEFNYAPGWPSIHRLNGSLVFAGRRMTLELHSGQIFQVPISFVQAQIPYIGENQPQTVYIQTRVKTDLKDLLRFIHESPLEKNIGSSLGNISFKGDAAIDLNLIIPIRKPESSKVGGTIVTQNGSFGVPDWKLMFDKLNGTIHFTENTINAKDLHGKLFGDEALLSIVTQHPEHADSFVQANLQTKLDIGEIQKRLGMKITSIVKGKSSVVAELHLYSKIHSLQSSEISIYSNLDGISINLPEPYGKKARELSDLQVDIMLKNPQVRTKINYNKLLTAAIDFNQSTNGLDFYSGEINLNGIAEWQTQPGLLLSATFADLDWDAIQVKLKTNLNTHLNTAFLSGINLNVGVLRILNQQINAFHMQVTKNNDAWLVKIQSDEILGELELILNELKHSIVGKFDHLYLQSIAKQTPVYFDPKNFPSLLIKIHEARINQKSLGFIGLKTTSTPTQLTINDLTIVSELADFHAQGYWRTTKDKNFSALDGVISTARLNDLLKSWDMGSNNFVGGKGEVNFNLSWPSTPYHPIIKGMSGNVSLDLGKGRVIDIGDSNNAKMDLGRLFNFFSISSIPRRLTFDFSDMEKGYGFDYIKGDFNIENGDAFTENAYSEGPMARIDISGRIGLVNKDIDLIVGVTPHVSTTSLPAMMMLWNPIAAAATLVVGQVAGAAMSKSKLYQYSVQGQWYNPTWKSTH